MVHKSIVVIGKIGSGKSTVYNAMSSSGYRIYDTIGLGSSGNGGLPHNEAVSAICSEMADINVDYICIVFKAGRLDVVDTSVLTAVKEIFPCDNDKIILLVTNCNTTWLEKESSSLKKFYGCIPMQAVNFIPMSNDQEHIYTKVRDDSLRRLTDWLNALDFRCNRCVPIVRNGLNYKFTRNTFGNQGYYIGKLTCIDDNPGCFLVTNTDNDNLYWAIDSVTHGIKCQNHEQPMKFIINPTGSGNVLLSEMEGNYINVRVECTNSIENDIISIINRVTYKFTMACNIRGKTQYIIGEPIHIDGEPGCFVIKNKNNTFVNIDNNCNVVFKRDYDSLLQFIVDTRYAGNIILSQLKDDLSVSVKVTEISYNDIINYNLYYNL